MMKFQCGVIPVVAASGALPSILTDKYLLSLLAARLLRQVGLIAIISVVIFTLDGAKFFLATDKFCIAHNAFSH